jgi:molecular chaperone GrpE (heat shock protein)
MEYTIRSIAELEKRKQELNDKYKGLEEEIEKFYKRVLFKIKEPR